MLNRLYFYKDGTSFVYRLNPIVKLFGFFIFFLSCFFEFNVVLVGYSFGLVLFLILFSNISFKYFFSSLWRRKYFLIFLYALLFHFLEFRIVNLIFCKVLFLYLYALVIFYSTSFGDFIKGFYFLFNFFNVFGIKRVKIQIFFSKIFFYYNEFKYSFYLYFYLNELKGKDFYFYNGLSRSWNYLKNFRKIHVYVKNGYNEYFQLFLDKQLDKRKGNSYNYLNKFKLRDYIFIGLNLLIIVYYVWLVK